MPARWAEIVATRRCGATCGWSATHSGACSSSRSARSCWPTSSASASSRAGRANPARRTTTPRSRATCDRSTASARPRSCARSASTSSSRTSPRPGIACAAGAATSARSRSRASRSRRPSACWPRAASSPPSWRAGPQAVSLELVITAHPTEAARRTVLQAQLQLSRLLEALDDPDALALGTSPARGRRGRRDHRALAGRRGALAASARGRRDPPRAVVLRDDAAVRGARRAGGVPRAAAGGARAVPLRLLGRRRPGRQSGGRAPHRHGMARARAPAGAHPLPRRGARPRARHRRVDADGARERGAAALDRARRGRARRLRARDRRPELRRALPAQAQLHRQAAGEPARAR